MFLASPDGQAGLAEGGGLLVTEVAGDRHAGQDAPLADLAVDLASDLISGSIDSGMPISAAMSSSQDRVSRSISMVREALVGSVMCSPPSTPPVMFQMTQVSMLPKTRSPASALARAPSTLSRIQRTFGPEK